MTTIGAFETFERPAGIRREAAMANRGANGRVAPAFPDSMPADAKVGFTQIVTVAWQQVRSNSQFSATKDLTSSVPRRASHRGAFARR